MPPETPKSKTPSRKLTLLGIFAHPDDESFGAGATLAKYSREGVDVHICIATDGAAGACDLELLKDYPNLETLRAEELRRAVAVLEATLHTLPYRDSGMAGTPDNENPASLVQAPLDDVARHLVALMRTVRPDVVLTHNPDGDYFHPDHIHVNQATSLAWERVGDPSGYPELGLAPWQPQRLFWMAMPRTWIRWFVRGLRLVRKDPTKFGRDGNIDMTRLGTPDEQIHTRIAVGDFLDIGNEASRQHRSQGGQDFVGRYLPRFLRRRFFGTHTYTQAHPAQPLAQSDFFEGL